MTPALYTVRLTQGFRIVDRGWATNPHRPEPRIARAFTNREAAEQFALENLPAWLNPFDQKSLWVEADGTMHFWRWDEDLPTWEHDVPRKVLEDFVRVEELPPLPALSPTGAEGPNTSNLMAWWEAHKVQMDAGQRTRLWSVLGIAPYRIDEVEMADFPEEAG